jgi:hypothetical protein
MLGRVISASLGMRAAPGYRFRRAGAVVGFAAVGIVSAVCVGSTASGAVSQSGVLTTPRDEILPAADRWFLWSQNSATHPHLYAEYVEANPASSTGPGPRIRVNAVGTQGFSGGILPSGRVIYQQVNGHQSNLKFFNPPTRVRNNPPVGVNTPAWEYRPSASGAWILFGRFKASTHRRKIILFDLFSQQVILLADRPADPSNQPSATPGQVNGNFAVWSQCTATACNVWEYDIATATKTRLPNATPGHYNYAPSVDTAGTVYFAHGGRTCGGATIEKQPLGGAAAAILPLRNRDVTSSSFADRWGNASPSLLFAKYNCKTGSNDVYSIYRP